ncbi:MAG TPA: HAMP domain-containing sensor histidine kinase [Actinomycetota bacterium]|nr:HAMP domain-containing sensor histidine kinase [Actinomycetota bacterium]
MTDDRGRHDHPHGPPWGGPPWRGGPGWGSGKPPWWPEDEDWPPRGPEAWRGMRRRFRRKLVIGLAILLVAIVGLSWFLGAVVFGGEEHRGPFFFPFGLVVAGVVVFLVVRAGRRFASPVVDVMEAADRVAAGDYDARVPERGPREVRRLGRSFNQMAERLGTDELRRRQLLADVAHELRTPLSVIQANLEALLDGLYPIDETHLRPVLEETRTMSRLLTDLQTLSTAEAGALALHREPTAPRDLVDAAVASFSTQASDASVRLVGRADDDLPELDVDRVRIGEVLANFVANALRHTPAGGEVTAAAGLVDGGIELSVADTGTGIDPERLPNVFDRFSRAPDSPGAGLGLAIARSLVEAHGGTIRADSGPGGTTIAFVLPR